MGRNVPRKIHSGVLNAESPTHGRPRAEHGLFRESIDKYRRFDGSICLWSGPVPYSIFRYCPHEPYFKQRLTPYLHWSPPAMCFFSRNLELEASYLRTNHGGCCNFRRWDLLILLLRLTVINLPRSCGITAFIHCLPKISLCF